MEGYGQSGGTDSLRAAFASYYQNRFSVRLDSNSEILVLIGSKERLFNLNQVIVNTGDLVLLSDPDFPVYDVGTVITQALTYHMPLLAKNGVLPVLKDIPSKIVQEDKLMWFNYPNNPIGAIAQC